MVQPYYAQPNIVQRMLVQQGWGRLLVGGVLGVAILGYLFLSRSSTPRHLTSEAYTQEMAPVDLLSKAEEPKTLPDPRIAELLARQKHFEEEMRLMREAELRQQKVLEDLLNRKPVPDKEPPKKPGKPQMHRQMGYMAFHQPDTKGEEVARYTLAAGDTIMPCAVLTAMHSDVESNATVKITEHIYDTRTRQRLLVPHGATLLVRYHSAQLVYGNERLPATSNLLTLPNGTSLELNDEPLMDAIGQAGLVSDIDRHYLRALGAVVIQGVLRGSVNAVSGTNPYATGFASAASGVGNQVVQKWIDLRPTITVNAGEACNVILTRPLELPEYVEKRS